VRSKLSTVKTHRSYDRTTGYSSKDVNALLETAKEFVALSRAAISNAMLCSFSGG